jgi:ribulose-phosphate 3-epimerase
MIEVIPSINVDSFEEVKERIRLVEPYVSWVHLDVADGVFTKRTSWHDARDLVGFQTKLKLEVHLMIDQPEREIDEWAIVPAERLIFHQEATHAHNIIIEKIHNAGKQAGIAINPDTNWIKLFPYISKVELIQFLAVNPGWSGQAFSEETIHKIKHVRSLWQDAIIEIDGGITFSTARRCAHAGANVLVAASAIFETKDKDIGGAIEKLKNIQNSEHLFSHLPGKTPAI